MQAGRVNVETHTTYPTFVGVGYWDLHCVSHEEVVLIKPSSRGIGHSMVLLK
jgi:hypothetical protein